MSKRQPPGGQAPVVQRIRIRYTKRGPLRFTSHRDFARAIERAIHRAGIPIAYSQGFTPHPKISFASAAPTGVASEAEYLELALRDRVVPAELLMALDAALSPGLDVVEAVEAVSTESLADRITASRWRIELPGVDQGELERAVTAFLAREEVLVERLTKQGRRTFDTRAAVYSLTSAGPGPAPDGPAAPPSPRPGATFGQAAEREFSGSSGDAALGQAAERELPGSSDDARLRRAAEREFDRPPDGAGGLNGSMGIPCGILDLVVRQVTPSVRPDDVLSGLRVVAGLEVGAPARVTRLAQGTLTSLGEIVDPLAVDRDAAVVGVR